MFVYNKITDRKRKARKQKYKCLSIKQVGMEFDIRSTLYLKFFFFLLLSEIVVMCTEDIYCIVLSIINFLAEVCKQSTKVDQKELSICQFF